MTRIIGFLIDLLISAAIIYTILQLECFQ